MPSQRLAWCAIAAGLLGGAACSSAGLAPDGGPLDGPDAAAPHDDARPPSSDGAASGAGDDATAIADGGAPPAADAALEDASMSARTVRTYGALGSSSTAGQGASRPDRAYVPLVHERLRGHPAGAGGVALINRGSGGARVDTLLAALPALEAARPEVVTILPLTDFVQTDPARFRGGYDELIRRLGVAGSTVFFGDLRLDPRYLCQGGGGGPGGCYGEQDRALLASKNMVVAELAAAHAHVVVVPVFDQNAAHPEWNATDGHPNDLGHQYLADTFWTAIEAHLGP